MLSVTTVVPIVFHVSPRARTVRVTQSGRGVCVRRELNNPYPTTCATSHIFQSGGVGNKEETAAQSRLKAARQPAVLALEQRLLAHLEAASTHERERLHTPFQWQKRVMMRMSLKRRMNDAESEPSSGT